MTENKAGQSGTNVPECPPEHAEQNRTMFGNVRPRTTEQNWTPLLGGGSVVVRSVLYRQGRRSCSPASPVMGLVRPPRSMNRHGQTDPADFHRHRRADRHRHPAMVRHACPPRPATVTARQTGTAPPCHTEGQGAASMVSGYCPTSHHTQGQPRATAVERRGMAGAMQTPTPLRDRTAGHGLRRRGGPIFSRFSRFEKPCSLRHAAAPYLVTC